jgi:two-component system cell cycle response regulator
LVRTAERAMTIRDKWQIKTLQREMPADLKPSGPQSRRIAFLTVIRGGKRDLGRNVVVNRPVVIGRAEDAELPLQDLVVSWRHARVSPRGNHRFVVEDLGSTNGTHVDGGLISEPWTLREGEKIFVGDTVVRFSMADEMDLGFQDLVSQLVSTDPLTGLESKRSFDDALDYALAAARANTLPLSILMMDMDGVKTINDTHGHLFGAHSIGETGRLIARILGPRGQACRFGGDEFTAFLPGLLKQQAVAVGEELRSALESANLSKDGIALRPTISIGVASFPEDGAKLLELVAAADRALYRAKAAGRNCVSV